MKQGCVFSTIIFNIFINKISNIFDESCAPVQINSVKLNSLLWADDLLLVSETPTGLQNSINKMNTFYHALDLKINTKKTKVMIFNKSGAKLDKKYFFSINDTKLEITDQYQYLGLKLRPSGSMTLAVQELHDKASRAWYSISNIVYKNKRMEVKKILGIFDSLVTPVATYGSPFWLPYNLPQKCFKTGKNLLEGWETLLCEKLNQQCCRMILSVNKKTSRLAVLGELARYPIFISTLSQCLNYKLSLKSHKSPLMNHVMTEMTDMTNNGHDSWLTRVTDMEKLLKLPRLYFSKTSGKKITALLKSKFDRFWLDKVNEVKLGQDNSDHNKLRTYKTFKASFTREPYLDMVRNRNQRSFLRHLRVSSHTLAIEQGRHSRPVTPVEQRICQYCNTTLPRRVAPTTWSTSPPLSGPPPPPTAPQIDTEFHFLIQCPRFSADRNCVFGKISSIMPQMKHLTDCDKFLNLLCPTMPQTAKLANKLIRIMFEQRKKLDFNQ